MNRYIYTLAKADVGLSDIKLPTRRIFLASAIGYVQPNDVGKWVFDSDGVIQVESDEQRDRRNTP